MQLTKEQKKKIKSDRLKNSIVEAAKEMIIEGGVESAMARDIAERAGYSLGTLYNHFKNLDEVLWFTRDSMISDIHKELYSQNEISEINHVIDSFTKYIDFYFRNTNVFKFFYFHKLDEATRLDKTIVENDELLNETNRMIEFIKEYCNCSSVEAELSYKNIIYMVHGMLVLVISGNDEITKETIKLELENIIKRILRK